MTFVSSSQRIFAKGYEHLYRRLSVRECARIQTFPDNFRFVYSDVKDGYKMVGNAVPPRLAWFLAVQMKKAFTKEMGVAVETKKEIVKQISVKKIAEHYSGTIVKNKPTIIKDAIDVDLTKNVLISLVKADTVAYYADQSARIYYTGKKFPSTVALNKLYYFIPYMKGKGIRDLYYIKIARVGTKQEVHPECDENDFRLVFEIEFVKQLFTDYLPVHLNIWRTFTDTKMERLIKLIENEENNL